MPHSVIMADIYSAGVTSNAGLRTLISGRVMSQPQIFLTSSASLSSMGICSPEEREKSIGSYLIGSISVRGDAVSSGDNHRYLSPAHKITGHIISN